MAELIPIPPRGELFLDARGPDRTMRVTHHPERDVVVVSLWSGDHCRASFRLPVADAGRLRDLLGIVTVGTTAPAGDLGIETDYPGLSAAG